MTKGYNTPEEALAAGVKQAKQFIDHLNAGEFPSCKKGAELVLCLRCGQPKEADGEPTGLCNCPEIKALREEGISER